MSQEVNNDTTAIQEVNNNTTANENNKNEDGCSWGSLLLGLAAAGAAVAGGIALKNHMEKKKKAEEPGLLGALVGIAATGANAFIDSASSSLADARNLDNRTLVNQSLYGSGMKKAAAEAEFQRRAGLL